MKKIILLFMLVTLLGSQTLVAESYQRWIYWVNSPSHQVSAAEQAEITEGLYSGKLIADKTYKLATGVTYKIPHPSLYLSYIEKCVKVSDPSAKTPQDVIQAIKKADKMHWGTDVSVKVKNYWYSISSGKVVYTNFTGEGKDVDFLLINGIPTIKCDCGNPLEAIIIDQTPAYTYVPVKKSDTTKKVAEDKQKNQQTGSGGGKRVTVPTGAVFTPLPKYDCYHFQPPYYRKMYWNNSAWVGHGAENYSGQHSGNNNGNNNNFSINNEVTAFYGATNNPKPKPKPKPQFQSQPKPKAQVAKNQGYSKGQGSGRMSANSGGKMSGGGQRHR